MMASRILLTAPRRAAALQLVRDPATPTRAAPAVQAAIDARLTPFPSLARTQTHRANVRVPAGVAALLELDPTLLPAAVDAFVDRDPGDMRACKRMETFPPTTAVYARVSMTRCQYAALARGERFIVPRVFGDLPPQKSPQYLPAWVGAKLACGMEILLARSASAGTGSAWRTDEVCMKHLCL
jgi:hypothetical protein